MYISLLREGAICTNYNNNASSSNNRDATITIGPEQHPTARWVSAALVAFEDQHAAYIYVAEPMHTKEVKCGPVQRLCSRYMAAPGLTSHCACEEVWTVLRVRCHVTPSSLDQERKRVTLAGFVSNRPQGTSIAPKEDTAYKDYSASTSIGPRLVSMGDGCGLWVSYSRILYGDK